MQMLPCLKDKFRYIGFILTMTTLFTDYSSRSAISLTMIGGMTKTDCKDPNDDGEFCWSDKTKAALIGAYYYGYVFQFILTTIARKYGCGKMMKICLLVSGVVQFTFPWTATISPALVTALQSLRGFFAGILMPSTMEFARVWGIGTEGATIISFMGAAIIFGLNIGPSIGGFITITFGWRYYYIFNGLQFLLLFVLYMVLLPDKPTDARFMSENEKALFRAKESAQKEALQKKAEEQQPGEKVRKESSLRFVLSKGYLWSFCIFMHAASFTTNTSSTLIPFYMNEVQGASTELLSYLQIVYGIVGAGAAMGFKRLLPILDRILPWKVCRSVFLYGLPLVRFLVYILLNFTSHLYITVALQILMMISLGSAFAGSIFTVTYELDPNNASFVLGIYNSFAEVAAFCAPLLQVLLTESASSKQKGWQNFFCLNASYCCLAILAVALNMVFKPEEWKKHPTLIKEEAMVKNLSSGTDRIQTSKYKMLSQGDELDREGAV